MMDDAISIDFQGPFNWLGNGDIPSIFDVEAGHHAGIYLWTVEISAGELIYYVGITSRSFSQRMKEHFKEHFAGFYHLCSPNEFVRGEKIYLWNGMYGATGEKSLQEFVRRYSELSEAIIKLAETYRFYVASLKSDKRILERIEAGIANHLYDSPNDFQEKGIIYRPRWQSEEPLKVIIHSTCNLIGLPSSLEI